MKFVKQVQSERNEPCYLSLEQPRSGKLKLEAFIKDELEKRLGARRLSVSFCKWDAQVQKDTLIWSDSTTCIRVLGQEAWRCTRCRPCPLVYAGFDHKAVRGSTLDAQPFPPEFAKIMARCYANDIMRK